MRAQPGRGSATGGRPTWAFKAGARSREAMAARSSTAAPSAIRSACSARRAPGRAEQAAQERKHSARSSAARWPTSTWTPRAEPQAIRARYTELVKRCHPDANGGDRSAEHKLQRVIQAYQDPAQSQDGRERRRRTDRAPRL